MEQTLRSATGTLAVLLIIASYNTVSAALNPAAVYCTSLGYRYVTEATGNGDFGYCMVDGKKTDAWKFIQGEESPEKSYCTKRGYKLRVVNDYGVCGRWLLTESCAVCVMPNGTEQEVTEAMGLTFQETTCGDGRCGIPEDYSSCPKDCGSGDIDGLCDAVKDGICDQDCSLQNKAGEDMDCTNAPTTTTARPGPLNPKARSTTTLPAIKPLPQSQTRGCIPLLLAPISLLLAALLKTL
jgi:putative hemolysin